MNPMTITAPTSNVTETKTALLDDTLLSLRLVCILRKTRRPKCPKIRGSFSDVSESNGTQLNDREVQ